MELKGGVKLSKSLRQVVLDKGLMSEEKLSEVLNLEQMSRPNG